MINKDTLIFGSFAKTAGNTGCIFFNNAFKDYSIDAIYKSFSVSNIEDAIKAARVLNFKGFAITMPFKKEAIKYIDESTKEVKEIGATNTIINNDGFLKAYNTDYLAALEYLQQYEVTTKNLIILGNGGYAAAVAYAAKTLNINFSKIVRENWNEINKIKNSIVYNCTPVKNIVIDKSNNFIDCLVTSHTGKELAQIQASYQFELYTGLKYPKL